MIMCNFVSKLQRIDTTMIVLRQYPLVYKPLQTYWYCFLLSQIVGYTILPPSDSVSRIFSNFIHSFLILIFCKAKTIPIFKIYLKSIV
jgi:hypothetical protein